ncbi:MAG: MBL fold metallo-hydrolase [Candidatus Zixiibacteriota bacterium]|nr:MAG: MBL fold metallo-hydrolase [candidate division Zixibacteria bacterium]
MKITIVYDNETGKKGLRPDWGFACVVEASGWTMLFDTGADGALLLETMRALQIEPDSIDGVFVSHAHYDHTGGLAAFLNENGRAVVYVPTSLKDIRNVDHLVQADSAMKLHENIYSTGELGEIEQSLIIKTDHGLVLIVGCAHSGVPDILEAALPFGTPYALVGGLHDFNEFDCLKNLKLICPTHCTRYKSEIESLFGGVFVKGGAGVVLKL